MSSWANGDRAPASTPTPRDASRSASRPAAWRCSRRTPSTGSAAIPRTSGGAAAVRAEGPSRRAARGGHVLRARRRSLRRYPSSARRERVALEALLPGPVTLLLANRAHRFRPGVRAGRQARRRLAWVARPLHGAAPLGALGSGRTCRCSSRAPTSPGARCAVAWTMSPRRFVAGADLVLDGGELPGIPSTVHRPARVRAAWRVAHRARGPVGAYGSGADPRLLLAS